MLFVVNRHKLQWNISLVRDDRTFKTQGSAARYMRLEAKDDYLQLDGKMVSAQISATVYEPGVLFLKIKIFKQLLATLKYERFVTLQVTRDELVFDRIRMPLDYNDMLLYPNPDQAPQQHPSVQFEEPVPVPKPPKPKPKPEFRQLTLWAPL